jgi:hypothetical protein
MDKIELTKYRISNLEIRYFCLLTSFSSCELRVLVVKTVKLITRNSQPKKHNAT